MERRARKSSEREVGRGNVFFCYFIKLFVILSSQSKRPDR